MVKATIVVVTTGGSERFEGALRRMGYEIMPMPLRTFEAQLRMCTEEFKQGIPLAVIHGVSAFRKADHQDRACGMSEADRIAKRLKQECGCPVILVDSVTDPIKESDRVYDVTIPPRPADLMGIVETFLGFEEY